MHQGADLGQRPHEGRQPDDLGIGSTDLDRAVDPEGRAAVRHYGRLGLQLALAFAIVALGGVVVTIVTSFLLVISSVHQLVARQEVRTAKAAAVGAAASYRPIGWAARLGPEIALIDRSEARILVKDEAGRVVRSSVGYSSFPGQAFTEPVVVAGRRVGSVTVRFGNKGVAGIVRPFNTQRWRARIISGTIGVLFALIVSLILAPRIIAPVDRVLLTARARRDGLRQARVGAVRGFRNLRELAATFDQMADQLGQEDQARRNLIAYIAHDLRTPIAVLQASTEALIDGVTEVTPASIESLHDEAVRLGQMVGDLELLAAAEAASLQLRLSWCDLAAVAGDTADSLSSIFDAAQVRLTRRLRSVRIHCDQARMREVISNLMTNAVKFTPAGGEVTLATERRGDWAVIQVSDTGVGIPQEELPHLLERFYRGRGSEQISGRGLGLAIVNELVHAHRGTINIGSEVGEGTQVTIEIPIRTYLTSGRSDDPADV